MRKLVTVLTALTSFCLPMQAASAKQVRIGVLVSNSTLHLKCLEAHGIFQEGSGGSYSCDTFGPNGGGHVECDGGGRCTGSCSRCVKAPAGSVEGALGKPTPVKTNGGVQSGTGGGGSIVRDHRNGTVAAPTPGRSGPATAPGNASTSSPGSSSEPIVRDHRRDGNSAGNVNKPISASKWSK